MRRRLAILATAIWIATPASSAFGHHNHQAYYDLCQSVTVEGRVERVEFKDPHALIVVRQDDGTAYAVDWMTLGNLTRSLVLGPAKQALIPGARVTVVGAPIRTAAEIRERLPDFTREVNPRTIDARLIRAGDGFSWTARPLDPAICQGK
jgi:hypothetical protein